VAGPTRSPFTKAFACAAVVYVVAVVAVLVTLGTPNSEGYRLFGRLFAAVFLPAIVVGFLARRAATVWPLWKFIVFYVLVLVLSLILQLASMIGEMKRQGQLPP
jgi:hypothetical protein